MSESPVNRSARATRSALSGLQSIRNQAIWAGVIVLAVLCGMVAMEQHRWISQVSQAERSRLQNELRTKLGLFAGGFQEIVDSGIYALSAPRWEVERDGAEQAYGDRFRQWDNLRQPLFTRSALAVWRDGTLRLLVWDSIRSRFAESAWPDRWRGVRERIEQGEGSRYDPGLPELLDLPRFGSGSPQLTFGHSSEDLLLELNLNYIRDTLVPDLLNRYVSDAGKLEYNTRVYAIARPSPAIYQSADWLKSAPARADAEISFFEARDPGHEPRRGRFLFSRGPREDERISDRPGDHGPGPERFRIAATHRAGSLEILVAQARHRNLVISSGPLLLILATAVLLVRVLQEREKLAALQMNFVTGVSHELRTPLSVIRTAAFNLRGKTARHPDQVEKYGKLIEGESEKLAGLVQRVLLLARAQSGQVTYRRSPVEVEPLIREAVEKSLAGIENPPRIDIQAGGDLSCAFVDRTAVEMALRNMIENALKYGLEPGNWIGVSADSVADEKARWIEIRVADRGPGIPESERLRIFDPFFRGGRAQEEQIHGTGLGLNLAKLAIGANGGTIEAVAGKSGGAEFIVRLPAAEDGTTA